MDGGFDNSIFIGGVSAGAVVAVWVLKDFVLPLFGSGGGSGDRNGAQKVSKYDILLGKVNDIQASLNFLVNDIRDTKDRMTRQELKCAARHEKQ